MKILNCRITLIWIAPAPELLAGASPGPLGAMSDPAVYSSIFNGLLGGVDHPTAELPWPLQAGSTLPPKRNKYWQDAIVRTFMNRPAADRGRLAWKASIQLKHKGSLLKLNKFGRSFGEGWYFPTGAAVSATAWLTGELTGERLVAGVSNLQGAPQAVEVDGVASTDRLDDAARRAIDVLRTRGLGLPAAEFVEEPTLILTIAAARHDPDERDRAAAESGMLKDALIAAGATPAVAVVPAKDIFTLPHARLIWRPDSFLSTQVGLHRLGCLHRNVTMATMHVASAIRAATVIMAAIDDAGQASPRLETYGRPLAGLLGRLNDPAGDEVYKLQCLRDQIAASRAVINRLRDRFDMAPLGT